jgi:ABC-2 type transport system permease protein
MEISMLEVAYILSVILMVILPVVIAACLRRITPVPWLLFSLGALTFTLSQVVHLPLNNWLAKIGWLNGETITNLPLWRVALTAGLTAGLCEGLARTAGYLFLQKCRPGWLNLNGSLMIGLGHGGIESMVFGGVLTAATVSALLPLRGFDLTQLGLPPEQLAAARLQIETFTSSPWLALLPLLERIVAISAHLTLSMIVWKAFARQRLGTDWYYIPLAIAFHATIDMAAVWASTTYKQTPLIYLAVMLMVLAPGWTWAILTLRRSRLPKAMPGPLRGEMGIFWVATVKEIRQAWRTKRMLVVWAVFLLFGMASPLLAKFTPEIIRSVEGAEMFASLIPTPTTVDAMTQYIKNITQFGFILAVLLAMGSVVGEKERGVAPMILSKPMARWAFIASKFTAQVFVYLVGFILSTLGAYYYTLVLFGSLDFGNFILLNGVLLLWLVTFVGISLLGSTVGKSTVAAGGIGLGLSIGQLLLGSIPNYGILFPEGLLTWAANLSQSAAGLNPSAELSTMLSGATAAQGGAAASALTIILMSLVMTIGFFEQQEL